MKGAWTALNLNVAWWKGRSAKCSGWFKNCLRQCGNSKLYKWFSVARGRYVVNVKFWEIKKFGWNEYYSLHIRLWLASWYLTDRITSWRTGLTLSLRMSLGHARRIHCFIRLIYTMTYRLIFTLRHTYMILLMLA